MSFVDSKWLIGHLGCGLVGERGRKKPVAKKQMIPLDPVPKLDLVGIERILLFILEYDVHVRACRRPIRVQKALVSLVLLQCQILNEWNTRVLYLYNLMN